MIDKIITLPTFNVSLGQAIIIVKTGLEDESIPYKTRVLAIDHVAKMETHNSVTTLRRIDSMSEWISVEDRLPDAPGHYLVCTSINYWHGGCLDENEERKDGLKCGTPEGYEGTTMSVLDCYFDGTGEWNRVWKNHVTHWMPLPDAPENKNGGAE